MFHFPAFPPHPMYSDAGDTTSLVPGFPIRTSSDQRSVDSSPRLIAASYVLHRLPVPRHPPCALKHLQHKIPKMRLGKIAHQHQKTHPPPKGVNTFAARCSQPLSTNQTPHPTTKAERKQTHRPTLSPGPDHTHRFPRKDEAGAGLLPQSPIVCSVTSSPKRDTVCRAPEPETHYRPGPSNESPRSGSFRTMRAGHRSRGAP